MDIQEIKKQVCTSGKLLLSEGLVARTWGNVSMRVDGAHMVITPSGLPYNQLTPDDMVLVNFITLKYQGILKPSSELKLHAETYKRRIEVCGVIHTHQMKASIFAAARQPVPVPENYQSIFNTNIIQAAPYALPNTNKITYATVNALGKSNAALMSNHGVVCVGENLEKAFLVAQSLEEICEMNLAK